MYLLPVYELYMTYTGYPPANNFPRCFGFRAGPPHCILGRTCHVAGRGFAGASALHDDGDAGSEVRPHAKTPMFRGIEIQDCVGQNIK